MSVGSFRDPYYSEDESDGCDQCIADLSVAVAVIAVIATIIFLFA